ncbi:Nodulation protein H [Linum grandiflorum]
MVVVVLVVFSSVYISSVCLKQVGIVSSPIIIDVIEKEPCPVPNIEPWEIPYVHYPKPETYSRAECECNPVRYFAILSMQRSGSGWFETLLNNHTNVSSNGEIFSVKVRRKNVSTIVETLDRVYNLDWLSSASKNECSAAVGFKWMLNQGVMQHHEEVVEYFRTRGVSAIFLFRRNLLRRMVSVLANEYDRQAKLLNGTHKSHVHSPHEVYYQVFQAEILARYKPFMNATSLIHSLKQVENTTAQALEYFKSTRHMVLYYEDIVQNRTKLSGVLDFLKVPQQELKSRQVKIHKGSLSNQVQNWEEVQAALQGTEYQSFLDIDY